MTGAQPVRVEVADAATTQPLRRAVLRPEWPAGAAMHGDEDPHAVHLAAFDGDELVGTCLLLDRPYPNDPDAAGAVQLRGMATVPALRSRGVGAQVVAAAVEHARARGGRLLWCEARTSAMAFYARHGFETDGPEYVHGETGIPHHLMRRPL